MAKNDTTRVLIEAADRLANGTARRVQRASLTVTALAREAGVSRATANRHPRALQYLKELKAKSPAERVKVLETRIRDLRRDHAVERAKYRQAIEILAQRVQVLTVALEQARRGDNVTVIDLPTERNAGR